MTSSRFPGLINTADVVIVGGGIVGMTLAYELAIHKVRVILLEAKALASGTTGNSFAWINATSKTEDETYHRLNAAGLKHYQALAAQWGEATLGLHGGGWLTWSEAKDPEGCERLRQRALRLQAWDYPVALLDQTQMQDLEPQVRFGEGSLGLFAPADQWLDAPHLSRFLAEQIRAHNGQIREHCPVIGFTRDATGQISEVETPQGPIATRLIVLAAGVQISDLVALITGDPTASERFPLRQVPGLLVETPAGSASNQIRRPLELADSSGLHLRLTPESGLQLGSEQADAMLTKARDARIYKDLSHSLLYQAAAILPGLQPAALVEHLTVRVGVRPVPMDGLPIVGPLPESEGVYVAAMHSGITLGPLIAHWLAAEIVGGPSPSVLTPYSPERFSYASSSMKRTRG